MTDDQIPSDALFIKFGRFQAGAFGRLAIVGLILLGLGLFAARYLHMW